MTTNQTQVESMREEFIAAPGHNAGIFKAFGAPGCATELG